MPPRKHITALGSSFAAGPGIDPVVNKAARRSGNNYAHQLASKLNADLTDLTASGATLLNILQDPQSFLGNTFPPQIDSLSSDTDIVTLTAGGNDLGYSSGLISDSYLSHLGPLQGVLRKFPPPLNLTPDQLTTRFLAVIDEILKRAPQAAIYIVSYASVLGECTRPHHVPLDAEKMRYYRDVADMLATAMETAVQARQGVQFVKFHEVSRGHEVGSVEPWVSGFDVFMLLKGEIAYHPNLEGHTRVAAMLYDRICGVSKESR